MVMFTCNRCSAALKKSQVENHAFQCGGPSKLSLTCHDCLKDFRGKEYESHTSCISEEARYGGKGVVVKQAGKKQNQWCEVVQNVLANNERLDADVHNFLKSAANLQNIPRKRPQFTNWAKNAMKCHNQKLIDKVFDVLIAEFSKLNVSEQPKRQSIEKDQPDKPETVGESETTNGVGTSTKRDASGNGIDDVNEDDERPKKKKKNKKGASNEKSEGIKEGQSNGTSEDFASELSENGKGKKKKKKNNKMATEVTVGTSHGVDEADTEDVINNEIDDNGGTHKKKKKKADASAAETPMETVEESPDEAADDSTEIARPIAKTDDAETRKLSKKERKQLKKKAKFDAEVAEIESVKKEDEEEVEEEKPKKSKKRKNGAKEEAENPEDDGAKKRKIEAMEVENEETPEEENGSPKKVKFDWHATILAVLRKSKNDEVPVKKVAKKVIDEYIAQYGDKGIHEKLHAKVNKKLQTCPGVRVLRDKVKLLEGDR